MCTPPTLNWIAACVVVHLECRERTPVRHVKLVEHAEQGGLPGRGSARSALPEFEAGVVAVARGHLWTYVQGRHARAIKIATDAAHLHSKDIS